MNKRRPATPCPQRTLVKQGQAGAGGRAQVGRDHIGKIPAIKLPVTFEAGRGFVTAVIHIDDSTLDLKFESPDQLLSFFTGLIENAVIVWPDNEFIKYYLENN